MKRLGRLGPPIHVSPSASHAEVLDHVLVELRHVPRDIRCVRCERRLGVAVKSAEHPVPRVVSAVPEPVLGAHDYCVWCARPITEAANALAPREGYIALARAWLGERPAGRWDPGATEPGD